MNMEEAKEKKEIEREEFGKLPADNEPDHQGPKRMQPWTQQITVRGMVESPSFFTPAWPCSSPFVFSPAISLSLSLFSLVIE
jgi:hypothetical protein